MEENKLTKIIILFFLILIFILNFSNNFFSNVDEVIGYRSFRNFQDDSEYLVYSKLIEREYVNTPSKYGLLRFDDEKTEFANYTSSFGLQGHVFSFMYNNIHISLLGMRLLCCILLSIVLMGICLIIYKKYNKLLGASFYLTFLLSPWIVAFARNLYWVEFTWFLPVLFALMLSTNYSKWKIYVPLIFTSILLKCLCGYEYITSIMLLTISFFIIDFFIVKEKSEKVKIVKTTLIVGIACLLAFALALIIHGTLRGNGNIMEGLKNIYQQDVLRRTILGSSENRFVSLSQEDEFIGLTKASIESSIFKTVKKYFNWQTNIILGIPGKYFKFIFIATIAILEYNLLQNKKDHVRDIVMFVMFLFTTLSWYILGKAHSYIHIHMNFVLWYFGFVQICLYIIFKFLCEKIYEIGRKENIKSFQIERK